jgi:hypothetical protein
MPLLGWRNDLSLWKSNCFRPLEQRAIPNLRSEKFSAAERA